MNNKKILAFMLSLAIVCPIGSTPMTELMPTITASAEDLTPTDESYFTFDATTGTITKYTGTDTDVVIPSTIDGVAVTSIGNWAFYNCRSLENVTIPNSVTSIGDYAFYRTSLISINIPNSVTSIGKNAFYYCESLTSVTFEKNSKLTTIGDYAFWDCTALESITIPNSVTSIGESVFQECTSLKEINVDSNNKNYSSEDGILFNKNKTTLISYPAGKENSSYTIPSNVTSIGRGAFAYCTTLESITIPNSFTTIDDYVFWNCTSLKNVTIPDGVTSIGERAFYCCTALESVTIPNSVTIIGDMAFEECTALEGITIPSSVNTIGMNAFNSCTKLGSIIIPNSVTSIGVSAFCGCISLEEINVDSNNENYSSKNGILFNKDKTTLICYPAGKEDSSYTISSNVTSIDWYAFNGCTSLESITIPNSVTSIGWGHLVNVHH